MIFSILLNWLVSAMVIMVTAYLLPGVHVDNFTAALAAAVVLGIVNAILKPILLLLSLPLNILTLGLFTLIIDAFLIIVTAQLVPGVSIDNFWWALLFSIVLSCINAFLHKLSVMEG